MKSNVLLKRVSIGAVIVACAAFTTYRYLNDWAPSPEVTQRLDTEMDHVQQQMRSWGGSDWSSRQYGNNDVSQTWFVKVPQLSDRDLKNEIYTFGGYDTLSGRKDGLRMNVTISSAPSSEWRITHVEISMVR